MRKKKGRRYTEAFKAEVLSRLAAGESKEKLSEETGIAKSALYKWAADARITKPKKTYAAVCIEAEERARILGYDLSTKDGYLAWHEATTKKMTEIARAKNADYTGASPDPFANFSRVADLGICTPEQGFLVRMTDKFARVTSFVQKGVLQVRDESVEDTLVDLANYALLLAGYIKRKRQQNEAGEHPSVEE